MTSSRLYRVASVLLVLFAAGHQFGFRVVDPTWNADATVAAMKGTFQVMGWTRSYWEFFSAFGFLVTAFLLFSAVLAWQLAGLPADVLGRLKSVRWAFAGWFGVQAIIAWFCLFLVPVGFSVVVTVVLGVAAWKGGGAGGLGRPPTTR